MIVILEFNGKKPIIGKNVFLAENSVIIGDVIIGDNSNIWYNVVIRGDVNYIRIGQNTNVQDGTVIHVGSKDNATLSDPKDAPTIIGDCVTIGHMCLLHGCTILDNSFIGMHSTILDYAKIGSYSLIGAKSLITMNKIVPDNEVWFGNPAIKKCDTDEKTKEMIDSRWKEYVKLASSYFKK